MDIKMLKEKLKIFLFGRNKEFTYHHCVEVGNYAFHLAQKYTENPEKVMIAGYLHDVSAIYSNDQRIQAAKEYGIPLCDEEIEFPMIIHQKISKVIAKEYFNIEDHDILSAIECHTTLKKGCSIYDLLLFVADKIKWDQSGKPPYLDGLISELDISLENAAFYYIDQILNNDIKVKHPWLIEAYDELKSNIKI